MLKKDITTPDGNMNGNNDDIIEENKTDTKQLKIKDQRSNEQEAQYTQNNRGSHGYN